MVVSNVHWTDGGLLDLARVGERARAVGAALVVDATQSLGAYPLDIAEVRPDFLVTAAYTWLLGPYSLGYLWVAPEHREGWPLEQTWLGRAGSEDFGRLVEYRDEYQPGAWRYDVGRRSNFALLPMAIAGLEQLLEWGVGEIRDTLSELTALVQLSQRLTGKGMHCHG